jgi:hypothetical protein
MTLDEIRSAAKKLARTGISYIHLQGGDPSMRKDILVIRGDNISSMRRSAQIVCDDIVRIFCALFGRRRSSPAFGRNVEKQKDMACSLRGLQSKNAMFLQLYS